MINQIGWSDLLTSGGFVIKGGSFAHSNGCPVSPLLVEHLVFVKPIPSDANLSSQQK